MLHSHNPHRQFGDLFVVLGVQAMLPKLEDCPGYPVTQLLTQMQQAIKSGEKTADDDLKEEIDR